MWLPYSHGESRVMTHCRSNWKLSSQTGPAAPKKKSSASQSLCYRYACVLTRTWSPSCKGFSLQRNLSMALKKRKGKPPMQALQCKSLRVRMLNYSEFHFIMPYGPVWCHDQTVAIYNQAGMCQSEGMFHKADRAQSKNNEAHASRRSIHLIVL